MMPSTSKLKLSQILCLDCFILPPSLLCPNTWVTRTNPGDVESVNDLIH